MEQIGIKNNTKLRLTRWRGLTRKIEKMQFFVWLSRYFGFRNILHILWNIQAILNFKVYQL